MEEGRRTPPCLTLMISFCPKQKTCTFYAMLLTADWRILRFIILCRKRVIHHNFWFSTHNELTSNKQEMNLEAVTFYGTFKHLMQPRSLTWFNLTSQPVFIFLVTLPSTFCCNLQAHGLLHEQFLLQTQTCNRPSLPRKDYGFHLSCHFSLRTHCNSTLHQWLEAITSL